MNRSIWLSAIALVPLVAAASPAPPAVTTCPNLYEHEPLLVFEAQGALPVGTAEFTLTLYNDGSARATKRDIVTGVATIVTATVAPADSADFLLDLTGLGAGTLCDVPSIKAIPTFAFSTLTVLRNATDTKGHTFSWQNSGYLEAALVSDRVWNFVLTTFPGL